MQLSRMINGSFILNQYTKNTQTKSIVPDEDTFSTVK